MDANQKKKLFNDFIATAKILIVDRSSRTRSRLTRTVIELGSKMTNIKSAAHIDEALEIAQDFKPALILSDYAVRGGSGFDLFKRLRDDLPELKQTILVLITSNISQTAVAKAAEEDVDAFLIKPYTANVFEKSLQNAAIAKLYPTEYIKTIEKGKALLFSGDFEQALSIFSKAIAMNNKPSLAYFYHGQAKYLMEQSESAAEDYNQGLEFNSIHYKCQIGLYELFTKEEEYEKAYSVVKNITKYFPANPKRLKEVIRLSIRTLNIPDINNYYETFLGLDERTEDVVDYVCAGMYILGKYNLEFKKNEYEALSIFEKVGISSAGEPKFLMAIIKELCRYGLHDEAAKHLKRFPHDSKDGREYKLSNLIINQGQLSPDDLIKSALEVYNLGIKDFEVFHVLIHAMVKQQHLDQVQKYIDEAGELYPEKKISIKKDDKTAA